MHLIGNISVKKTLDHLVQKGVPPVLLFEGTEGVGKRLFAKYLISQVLKGDKRIDKDTHPDVLTLDHQVDKIKQLLHDVDTFPFESPYRFYLIDDVDQMLPVHANALLKTFEEAPPFNRFILFATHIDRLLPTILSRSIHIHFSPIEDELVQNYLVREHSITPEQSKKISILAGGSIGKAKLLIEENFLEYYPIVLEALKYHLMREYGKFYETLDQINSFKETTTTNDLLTILEYWFLDLQTIQSGSRELFFPEEKTNLYRCTALLQLSTAEILTIFQKAREGLKRHIRLSRCLEYLFLSLR